jgi:small conductance mechanosensitive channel
MKDELKQVINNVTASPIAPEQLLQQELEQVSQVYHIIVNFFTNYSFQLLGAFLIFLFGYFVAGKIAKTVLSLCEKQQLDITLSRFLANTTKMVIVVMVTVISLGKLGVSVTPFIAAIGAISLGAGLALQGLLANYAAGFNIILTRPFVVGDTIQVQGVKGVVKEVLLAYSVIEDEDKAEITIPNKLIVGEILHNSKEYTLLEISVGISYQNDPMAAILVIENALHSSSIVNNEEKMKIGINDFGDSAINISIRLWIPTNTLYDMKFQANKAIYLALEKANITIPYPQHDVHIIESNKI